MAKTSSEKWNECQNLYLGPFAHEAVLALTCRCLQSHPITVEVWPGTPGFSLGKCQSSRQYILMPGVRNVLLGLIRIFHPLHTAHRDKANNLASAVGRVLHFLARVSWGKGMGRWEGQYTSSTILTYRRECWNHLSSTAHFKMWEDAFAKCLT